MRSRSVFPAQQGIYVYTGIRVYVYTCIRVYVYTGIYRAQQGTRKQVSQATFLSTTLPALVDAKRWNFPAGFLSPLLAKELLAVNQKGVVLAIHRPMARATGQSVTYIPRPLDIFQCYISGAQVESKTDFDAGQKVGSNHRGEKWRN